MQVGGSAILDRKCSAMLVAQMSNPMRCSSVLQRTFLLPSQGDPDLALLPFLQGV